MKILIAEDDAVSRRLLEKLLIASGYEVVATVDGPSAWELLQAPDAPRLALLDWMMPGMDGVEVCRQARKRVGRPYIYILLLTARDAKIDVIEGLESGADDYLTKPYNTLELKARLRVGKRILDLEDDLVAAREVMQFKATHDALTGLWNRAAILDLLQREVPRARRERSSVGILLGDLDHFKSVNDAHGHLAGDEVLRDVARRLSSSVREYDAVGRYGGEEFLVVMPGCDLRTTQERAEHLRAAISNQPVRCADSVIPVTLSLGAVASNGWGEVDVDTLLRRRRSALSRQGCRAEPRRIRCAPQTSLRVAAGCGVNADSGNRKAVTVGFVLVQSRAHSSQRQNAASSHASPPWLASFAGVLASPRRS